MKIKVINDEQEFEQLKTSWSDLVSRANVFIFQTFEWNRTWWKHFGKEGNLHIILFYNEDKLVGIAPLFLDSIHLMGRKVYECLRFIGSNVHQPKGEPLIGFIAYSDYLDFIVEPGYEKSIAQELVEYLKRNESQFDEIVFEEVPEHSVLLSHFAPLQQDSRAKVTMEDASSCAMVVLEKSWDDYLMSLKGKDRNKARKYLKKVEDKNEKIFNIDVTSNHVHLSEAYEKLVDLHQEQWNLRNFPGFFYEKRMYEFMKEVSQKFFDNHWLYIKEITSADKKTDVGIYLFFKFKKRLYGIIGGINQHSQLSREGLGHIALHESVKQAIDQKLEEFDFIRGLQEYKLRASNKVTTNKTLVLSNVLGLNASRRVKAAKQFIKLQRRLRVEAIQFKLSFKNKGFGEGIKHYKSFITQRIKHKRAVLAS